MIMSKFQRFGPAQKSSVTTKTGNEVLIVDWKDVENLRKLMSPNGKILGRKRLTTSAREQRMLSQAIKRARFMALLPYTSATL
jgi:small subunit ribosomal protein S18